MAPDYPRGDRRRGERPRQGDDRQNDRGRGLRGSGRDRPGSAPEIKYGERGGPGSVTDRRSTRTRSSRPWIPTVRRELVPSRHAGREVAGHLIMAARLLDDDPELAPAPRRYRA